jgi:hypothetical protein
MSQGRRPEGTITRGTTAPNRLRRVDRWIARVHGTLLRRHERPLVVDLGYGASPVTTAELFTRLRAVHSRVASRREGVARRPWSAARCRRRAARERTGVRPRSPRRTRSRSRRISRRCPRPSELAERLPKTLIHRNVPGERVHELLAGFDQAWAAAAPQSVFGPRQRWIAAVELLAREHPVFTGASLGGRASWRLGEVTLPWSAAAPARRHPDPGPARRS